MTGKPDAYAALLERYREVTCLRAANGVLEWDEYVTMPEGGSTVRDEQSAALSSLAGERLGDPAVGELLADLEDADLSAEQRAVTREIRDDYEAATRVPDEIEAALSETTNEARRARAEAKEADDFGIFAPHLESIVEQKREYARALDPDAEPYEALVGEFFPHVDYGTVERVLERLEEELPPLIASIRERDADLESDALHGDYDDDEQFEAARDLLDLLGFEWDRGRLDTFEQPFTFGLPSDARVCTWTDRSLYQTLWTTAHEGGHALYAQGLPAEAFGTPLAEKRGVFVDEAEASFWECHVFGRRAFWERFLPTLAERFPDLDVTPGAAYESVNHVREDNPVWVEADELTTQLHVLLRFEIERDLINGDLAVEDVPAVWNDRTEAYFGVRPDTLAEGCLQDIHWSIGRIGYFPTYALGHVLAAQFAAAIEDDLGDVDDLIHAGEFEKVLEWHREHVHRHGQRYTTPDLIRRATGEDLSADAFLEYVTGKYAELYGLESL